MLAAAASRSGMHQLSVSSGDMGGAVAPANDSMPPAGAGLPNAGLAADGSNESVAISGAQGRTEQNLFDPGEMQDRIAHLRDQLQQQGVGSGPVNMGRPTANIQLLRAPRGFGGSHFAA